MTPPHIPIVAGEPPTGTDNRWTLAERKKLAKQAHHYGHFEAGTDLWVFCPVCRERVHGYWDTATRQVRTKTAELERMVVDHLTDECRARAVLASPSVASAHVTGGVPCAARAETPLARPSAGRAAHHP